VSAAGEVLMAKPNDKSSRKSGGAGLGTITEEEHNHVSEAVRDDDGRDDSFEERKSYTPAPVIDRAEGGGFFDIYKPGQGYYTRIWTGVSFGVMVCWLAFFLYEKLEVVGQGSTAKYIQVGAFVASFIGLGLLGYWALALNRRVCDFLIATEGEMKKVNWTSRKEIIGSTKVVIFVMVSLAVLLFVVDFFFMSFFNSIGILKGTSILDTIRKLFR
jgi:preprotein translocase subunit SecE